MFEQKTRTSSHFEEQIGMVLLKAALEYPAPKIQHRYQKLWFLKCISFQIWLFGISILVFGGVSIYVLKTLETAWLLSATDPGSPSGGSYKYTIHSQLKV